MATDKRTGKRILTIRVDEALQVFLKNQANSERRSLNAYLVNLLEDHKNQMEGANEKNN